MAEKSYPDAYPIADLPDSPASGFVFPWRSPNGWVEKRSDGTVQAIAPITFGQALDFSSIKKTSSGVWAGATLSDGPQNSGSEGSGCWVYKGDDKNGTLSIVVWSSPDNRQIEGGWIRTRTNGTLGEWAVAPKASDFQVTTGNRTVLTGENWAIASGHVVTISYVDVNKSIKLKPAGNLTWDKVTQYVAAGGFTVPAKPASGIGVVELKFNPGKSVWEAAVTSDPMDARLVVVEAKATANETAIGGLDTRLKVVEKIDYNLNAFRLDNGKLYVAAEPIGIGFVHLRTDGQIEVATDAVMDKPANGFVDGPIATGGSRVVYGSGSRISDIGSTGVNANSRIYLSKSGKAVSSSAGTGRYIQNLGVYTDGYFLLDFSEIGTWVG